MYQVPFTFLNNDDTEFHQPSLWRIKLCCSLAEQTNIAKPYMYDWLCRVHFVVIMPRCQLFSNIKGMFMDCQNSIETEAFHWL